PDITVQHNRPDITLQDRERNITYLIDISVPAPSNIQAKQRDKIDKYLPLAQDLKETWKQNKVIIIPIIIGATGDNIPDRHLCTRAIQHPGETKRQDRQIPASCTRPKRNMEAKQSNYYTNYNRCNWGDPAKQRDKIDKYLPLAQDLKETWKQNKVIIIPIIIGATGEIPQKLHDALRTLNLQPAIYKQLQKIVVLESSSIMRQVLSQNT
ncbi:hypothetical protein QE152_g40978, partial [Popillia japonica]